MSEHTATPWHIQHEFDFEPTFILAGEDEELLVAACRPDELPNARANAAFIVRAVNAHDALVEAVKQLLQAYAPNAQRSADEEGEQCLHSSVQRARAALKLAEG